MEWNLAAQLIECRNLNAQSTGLVTIRLLWRQIRGLALRYTNDVLNHGFDRCVEGCACGAALSIYGDEPGILVQHLRGTRTFIRDTSHAEIAP